MKYRCKECGLESIITDQKIDAIKDLSNKGCTLAMGYKTWCSCGAINSFEEKGE